MLESLLAFALSNSDPLDLTPVLMEQYIVQGEENYYGADAKRGDIFFLDDTSPLFTSESSLEYTEGFASFSLSAGDIGNLLSNELFLVAMMNGSLRAGPADFNLAYNIATSGISSEFFDEFIYLRNKLGLNVEFPLERFMPGIYMNTKFLVSSLNGFDDFELKSGARLTWIPLRQIELGAFCEYTYSEEFENYITGGINARFYL